MCSNSFYFCFHLSYSVSTTCTFVRQRVALLHALSKHQGTYKTMGFNCISGVVKSLPRFITLKNEMVHFRYFEKMFKQNYLILKGTNYAFNLHKLHVSLNAQSS